MKRKKASGKASTVGDGTFDDEVLKSSIPVFVDFYADWCGPCRMVAPIIEELAEDYGGKIKFVKMNVDQNSHVAARYRIRSIPTLIIFKDGRIFKRSVGAASKARYARADIVSMVQMALASRSRRPIR